MPAKKPVEKKPRLLQSQGFINAFKAVVLIGFLGLCVFAVLWLWPKMPGLKDPASWAELKQELDAYAPFSWLILLGAQILQVVVAVIPGEPLELVAGFFCGSIGGLVLCLVGVLLGSMLIFYLVRWLGRSFIEKMFAKEKVRNFKLLNNKKSLNMVLILLFFIPGTPKDLLTYMAPLTPVKPLHFFLISVLARIPSILTSTYSGAHLSHGDFKSAALMYAVAILLGGGGLLFYHFYEKKKQAKEETL